MTQLTLPSVDDLIAKARAASEPLPSLEDEERFANFFDRNSFIACAPGMTSACLTIAPR